MNNIPEVKLGLVAVSRNCFPLSLSRSRRDELAAEYRSKYGSLFVAETMVEDESDMLASLEELRQNGCNALVVYLGNFGPETAETLLAQNFPGPTMYIAAAETSGDDLFEGRGDAYCGLLNASYNLKLRDIRAYIPENPVGTAGPLAQRMDEFVSISRAILGLQKLKVISFGPRPQDFLACNAPIKGLYRLGIEIQENSELDLYLAYEKHAGDSRVDEILQDMCQELSCQPNDTLKKMAQYELTLLDWVDENKGSQDYVVFANKCWPSFQFAFGFVPCYVNSRLAKKGLPVACEVDIYGAVSEYLGMCVSDDIVTLLDINNTVPQDMYEAEVKPSYDCPQSDLFMGFHCGNTTSDKLVSHKLSHHVIMCRTAGMETSSGTLNGDITPGTVTMYRLQSTADGLLRAYVAEGEVLDVSCKSFGGIGIVHIDGMRRFYRHVMIEKGFPHHGAFAFGAYGGHIYEVLKYFGILDIGTNLTTNNYFDSENPFFSK